MFAMANGTTDLDQGHARPRSAEAFPAVGARSADRAVIHRSPDKFMTTCARDGHDRPLEAGRRRAYAIKGHVRKCGRPEFQTCYDVAMSDQSDNLVLIFLRRLDARMDRVLEEVADLDSA